MVTKERKYFTELLLSIWTRRYVVLRPSAMKLVPKMPPGVREMLDSCSIYFVCTAPRMRIIPKSLERHNDDLTYQIVVDRENGQQSFNVTNPGIFARYPEVTNVVINSRYKFLIEFFVKGQRNPVTFTIDELANEVVPHDTTINRYEVVYVGQSRIGKSSGNIVSRLSNHSTLQEILGDLNADVPHKEVFLICFEIADPQYGLAMDPFAKVRTTDAEDTARVLTAFRSPPTVRQMTGIAEACYIRYFQPKYNLLLKDSFPSTDLKLLRSCYDLDFIAIAAEIDTEDTNIYTYSSSVRPHFKHIIPFDLPYDGNRRSFFQLSTDRDGTVVDMIDPKHIL